MNEYNKHLLLLIKRLLLVLLLFLLARVFFLILNYPHFSPMEFSEALKVFFVGMRFDLSVIIYFNIPVILMHILPIGKVKNSRI